MNKSIINCRGLSKFYHDGQTQIHVLNKIDFTVDKGARIAIVGPSGSGKSTLLHLLGGLDKPTSGQVLIENTDWQAVPERKRCQLRNQKLGFIYQFHHLLPEFSAIENVAMPLLLGNQTASQASGKAQELLSVVGLNDRLHHKPAQLSGGERQRVAIARALVHNPDCILADEPTGNLDHATALNIFKLMADLNETLQTALVIVTHDIELARRMDCVLHLQEGKLSDFNS